MEGMYCLILGSLIFFGIHFLPSLTRFKSRLIHIWGEGPYKMGFSILAALGLGLLIYGKAEASYIHIYQIPSWGFLIPKLLMLPASILLLAPYFLNFIRAKMRHPMLLGITLWAIGHLFANGDLSSVILFGSFLVFSILDMILINSRSEWQGNKSQTMLGNLALIVISTLVFLSVWHLHGFLFKFPVPS